MAVTDKLDMKAIGEEALVHLRELIRIDTTNPPGGETAACEYLRDQLSKEGIGSEILEKEKGRGNIVARLSGDGSKKPLLLQGHLDVVPAEHGEWSHPPFAAEIADGYLYGRGAVDMKNMVAMELAVILTAKRRGWPLRRDIIFAAVADEEAGCACGSKFLVEEHPEKVKAEYAFGEIGGFSLEVRGNRFWPIGVAEKGVAWLRITAKGAPGHGAMPNPDNAVVKIAGAAHKLGKASLPLHVSEVVQTFINAMADVQPKPVAKILRQATNPLLSNVVTGRLIPDKSVARSLYASLHNTVNVTVLRAGDKINVIPGSAMMKVDGRTLPGQTAEDLIAEIKRVIGKDYEIEVIHSMPPVLTDINDPVYTTITETIKRHDPQGVPIPYLVPGFTDTKYFSKTGAKCFGFSPVMFGAGEKFAELFHGHDERIPVEGFKKGTAILMDTVHELVC